jgi:aspartyl-tRNA(Asn)/glutamyl-tRNA(Gln) amidotransferase subunit C
MEIIDKATVKHVALLSRLALNDQELDAYSSQLASILSYITKLNEIDVANTPPTNHVLTTLVNVDRPDVPKRSLEVDETLANAPERSGDFFKIPKVIEGK